MGCEIMRSPVRRLFAVVLATGLVPAQPVWRTLPVTGPTPTALYAHGSAYDANAKRIVLFGGIVPNPSTCSDETWSFDGVRWKLEAPSVKPGPRFSMACCYDAARGRVVVFGGLDIATSTTYGDTWEWDGVTWSQRTPPLAPSARFGTTMVFDSVRRVSVLFGGRNASGFLADVWEWDGSSWKAAAVPGPGPSPRANGALCFDPRRGVTVQFAGDDPYGAISDGVWEWNGKAWAGPFRLGSSPSGRTGHRMVYDTVRGTCILFGGYFTAVGGYYWLQDTGEWDGTTWSYRTNPWGVPAPLQSGDTSWVWFPPANASVLYGGRGTGGYSATTYACSTAAPPRVASYGSGCPGGQGVPSLAAVETALPWLGESCVLSLERLSLGGSQSFTFGCLGASNTTWGSIPLPLDLGAFGMPGCLLHAEPLVTLPLAATGGRASWSIPVPADVRLVGRALYAQSGTSSPGTNPAGIVLSNPVQLTIGKR